MGLKESVIATANINLGYARLLTKDVSDEQFAAQPIAGKILNPPAWVIGHLAWAAMSMTGRLTGGEPKFPAGWSELFGRASVVSADAGKYPPKADLIKAYEEASASMFDAFRIASEERLSTPMPEPLNKRFPTVGDMAVFLLTSHQSTHLGQLSAWRRASGLPSVM